MKTRTIESIQSAPDTADDVTVGFYVADAASPGGRHLRVVVNLGPVQTDRPLSDYTNLTPANKTALRNLLTALRDQSFSLEGFA